MDFKDFYRQCVTNDDIFVSMLTDYGDIPIEIIEDSYEFVIERDGFDSLNIKDKYDCVFNESRVWQDMDSMEKGEW